MTIYLPEQRFIRAEVHRRHFASEDNAIAEAVRLLQRRLSQAAVGQAAAVTAPDPVLGAMQDAADEMDEIGAEVMEHRHFSARDVWPPT